MNHADQSHGVIAGKVPAVVASYDQDRRECRVHIPGLTDGTGPGLLAQIEYPIGDKSKDSNLSTEIAIAPGDLVWVEFECGDPRYPIITGYRNPQVGNSRDWRRWHHKNVETLAEEIINNKAGTDKRIQAGNDLQFEAGADALIRAGKAFKVSAGGKVQLISTERVLIQSTSAQIILKSASGTLVI